MLNWIIWNRTVYLYKNGWYVIKPKQTNKQTISREYYTFNFQEQIEVCTRTIGLMPSTL